jgi:16S rRNA C967 or C1407 C5-methylase (RsmB/RsmF family)/NOL1/NOP2/fmu family ribosome biogenesis protein
MNTLPKAFLTRMEALLGEEYGAFLETYSQEAVKALYAPGGTEAFDFPVEAIAHLPGGHAFSLEKPGNHPLHHAGAFYVQDPSAMATVSAVPFREGMKCLDLCASPGGKSVQIASRMGDTGFLVSNEINPSRCKVLYSNMERMGYGNVQVSNADPKEIALRYPSFFDLAVVDAPCSGEGMFRKYENASAEWSENAPAFCASRQKEILTYAKETVAPGGYLLYATCTFSPEENEEMVRWLMETDPSFSLCPLPLRLQEVSAPGVGLPEARRFYPHRCPGEGQFVALLKKSEEGIRRSEPAFRDHRQPVFGEELRILQEFLENNLQKCGDLTLCRYGGYLYSAPMPIPGDRMFCGGVTLGTVEKRRFVPHHHLFKCYGNRFLRKVELTMDDPRVKTYLTGGEIPCDLPDGWAAVLLEGYPLGGVKISDGRGKNHYPKGLRMPAG